MGDSRRRGRTPSTKTLALKIAKSSTTRASTRWQAILTLEPILPAKELDVLARQLLRDTKRGPVVRLCLQMLAVLEERRRVEADKRIADRNAAYHQSEKEHLLGTKEVSSSVYDRS